MTSHDNKQLNNATISTCRHIAFPDIGHQPKDQWMSCIPNNRISYICINHDKRINFTWSKKSV